MGSEAWHLNATLLPGGDRPADLWIVDGRFTFQPQDAAEELAPAGGYALPGLVDCHSHLSIDYARTGLPWGSRELVNATWKDLARTGILLLRDLGSVNDVWREMGPDGPTRIEKAARFLAPAGQYFGPEQPTNPEDLADAAEAHVRAGANWVKIIADWPLGAVDQQYDWKNGTINYPLEAVAAAVERVHALGARVAAHAISDAAVALAVQAGVDTVEHGIGMDFSLLDTMAARGTAWTPTAMVFLDQMRQARQRGATELVRWEEERIERFRTLLPEAARRRIPILAGTDFKPGGSLAQEVAALQKLGLDPLDALAAASTTARTYLGYPSLDEGAPADLVLYRADPRESPGVLERPQLILLGGQVQAAS